MEVSLITILISLFLVLITGWVWKIVEWVWIKPKSYERFLRSHGFRGHRYKIFYGNKKDIGLMLRESTSKPMECLSHDHFPRLLPFHYKTLKDYGEACFIWEGPTPTIVITKPEHIREIMMKIHDFQKPILHPLMKQLTNGLVRLQGQEWAQERKLINPAFHMHKLKHMLSAFQESCKEMIDDWEKMTSKVGTHEIEIWTSLHNMSADAISRAAFGSNFEEGRRIFELLREQIATLIRALQSVYIPGSRFLPTSTNNKSSKATKEIEFVLKGIINKRQKALENGEAPKDDLLGILLKSYYEGIQDKKEDEKKVKQNTIKLSLKQVIEECKLFYIAGQETTSALLTWTLILLSNNKDWQQQARQEVLHKFGRNMPDFDGLNELKKVNMILHEALRLYPPVVSLTRKVMHDVKVGDLCLQRGVQVNLALGYVQQDEKIWGNDAKEFNPQRFSQGILKATQGNMSFFSFGWGSRICIGSNFAMLEAKLTLAMILQRFNFELSPAYVHAPSLSFGTLRPQYGANLIFHRISEPWSTT